MSDGSEARKTSRNAEDRAITLKKRCSFCSFSAFCLFCESPHGGFWAEDESLWPVPALFLVVVALWQECPTAAKGWAWPDAPAPMWEASRLSPTGEDIPAAADEPAPADCARKPRSASSVRCVAAY